MEAKRAFVNVRLPVIFACAIAAGVCTGYLFAFYNISAFYITAVIPVTAVIFILTAVFS